MGRAKTFLARSGLAASVTALLISGASVTHAAPQPADTPITCSSGLEIVGTVCDVANSVVDALIPATASPITVPAGVVPDLPLPSLPPTPLDGVTVTVPVHVCNITAGADDVGIDSGCVNAPVTVINDGSLQVAAPVQVCGVSIGALTSSATGNCPATGPTITDGPSGGLAAVAAPVQICGITLGALNSSATGDCPATGPTAILGSGAGILGISAPLQLCGSAVGALDSDAAADCPSAGPTGGGGTGGGPISVGVPLQICGVAASANGAGGGSCPESAPATTTPATTPSTTPATTVPGAPDSMAPGAGGTTDTSVDPSSASEGIGAATANVSSDDDDSSSDPSSDGSSNLPVTGLSITVLLLGGAALIHSGLLARFVSARRLRRTAA
jgi:hypothetical protein